MPDVGFEQFYRDTATLTWPAADAIARRGRQRRRRQRIVAALGAATVLISAVAAGAAVRGGGSGPAPVPPASQPATPPTATTSPSGSPSAAASPSGTGPSGSATSGQTARPLTQVPLAAMLRPADAGTGTWTVEEEANGDWTVYFTLSLCTVAMGPGGTDLDTRERSLRRGEAEIAQRVRAFSPADAAAELAALRAKVSACATFRSRYTGEEITLRIVRDGFAPDADESFLVESRAGGEVGWHVLVRKGSLVAEVVVWPNSQDESVRVGRAAVVRLTQAAG